jgi:hypothetical protein
MFPHPKEISMRCSCPDHAKLCKHVAAVLYGVGSRLDTHPELFFVLRQVDQLDLIGGAAAAPVHAGGAGAASERRLEDSDLSSLFGIELEDDALAAPPPVTTAGASDRARGPGRTAGAPDRAKDPGRSAGASDRAKDPGRTAGASDRARGAGRSAGASDRAKDPGRTAGASDRAKDPGQIDVGAIRAGATITARELSAQGIPHSVMQRWLASGALEHSGQRGIYRATAATGRRIAEYLSRG